jgi:MFS family permease
VNGYGTRDGSSTPIVEIDPNNKPLETFWLLSIMNGASTIGRLTMATFSDKTGQLNMHIVSQIISSLLCMVLWSLAGSTTAAIAFCVIFGVTSGAVIGLPPASMANILSCTYNTPENKHLAHSKLGHWTGTMYSFAFLPALVGPLIAGHLITTFDTYLTVQLWSGGCLMVSAFCMIMTRWCLPCVDGELVKDKIKKFIGQKRQSRKVSTADTFISQATTRIGSEAVSPQGSKEKVGDQVPVTQRAGPNA